MRLRILLVSLLLVAQAWAGIVDDVRLALAQNNFSAAESALNSYRSQQGVSPSTWRRIHGWGELPWINANTIRPRLMPSRRRPWVEQLKQRSLDADPHLPIALGAALEVQSQVLAARGQRTQALAVLQAALRTYANTSIHDRLQKNLNLLSLQGKPAPSLRSEESLGAKLPLLAQLQGSPVLLFFWAHWCADCKAERPSSRSCARSFQQGIAGDRTDAPLRLHGAD